MPKISDERRAARRLQILEAAWRCFQRQGLHATTMDDIIREAGLSAGAVYSYFPGKEALILAAVTDSLGGIRDLVAPALATRPLPAPDVLAGRIMQAVADFSTREGYDLRRIALLGWSEAQRNEPLRQTMRDFYLPFRDALEAAAAQWQASGQLRPGSAAPDVARAILAAVLGYVVQSAVLGDVEPEEIARGIRALGAA
ncbi:MAG: TetR/AcrR family transcriptional regulator [Amaricoccus sp.]|uniref:TetR/AcrR family transcriptional regulator n=1 Tax=Amaricoccus sp. TaxID=1872485 RepID=UPI0039E564ED